MKDIGYLSNYTAYGDDQAFLNIFVYSKIFDPLFNYSLDENSIGSSIIAYGITHNQAFETETFGNYHFLSGVPAILHQYDRFNNIILSIDNFCPNTPYLKDNMRF